MAKHDEPKAPENAADVVRDAQREIGTVGDLGDAPVTPELQDAKARLVAAAADARTRAAAEYPFMLYDHEDSKRPPRVVHNDEDYNKAIDDGYDDVPPPTAHGKGDNAEDRELTRRAELRAREDLEKDEIKARIEAEREQADADTRNARTVAKGGKK